MQGSEGESSMSLERVRRASDLMQIGNQAFRENRLEDVILLLFWQSSGFGCCC